MDPRSLVHPLEAEWQDVLDAVLRPTRRPELTTKDVARLAPLTIELSRAYNAAQAEGRRTKLPLEARIAFSFPRDVPKGAGAVRELVASGTLRLPAERPLRVLDLGAGLGAMTWGLVRALAASGASGRVESLLVDEDEQILHEATEINRAARAMLGRSPVELTIGTRVASLESIVEEELQPRDVVLLGQVLSELAPREAPDVRVARQVALLTRLLEGALAQDGSLVIVEPALRERTRHLHLLRDRLLEACLATVFAPCLHASPCPMLSTEAEWCHEDLAVDLPSWTAPLARAAGLRWQGLTFSYLVLRRDGMRLAGPATAPGAESVRFRAVSSLLASKGKLELFACGDDGVCRRIRRLDRDAHSARGVPFSDLERGDIVTLTAEGHRDPDVRARAPIDERGRVARAAHAAIDVAGPRK